MNEEETINILEDMLEKAGKLYEEEFYTLVEDKHMWAVRGLLDLYRQEKEKNKKLEEVMYNLAQAIRFMSTNEKLTVEDIIKEFSKENEVTEEFMQRWEKSQREESHLKDKVIDMMAEDIFNGFILNFNTIKHVKEYYFNKVK